MLDNSAAAPGTPLAQVIPKPPQRPGGETVGLAAVGAECWGCWAQRGWVSQPSEDYVTCFNGSLAHAVRAEPPLLGSDSQTAKQLTD